jgi:hypothetical protein
MFSRLAFNWKAQTAHGLHSPFVFDLYTHVIDPIYKQNPSNFSEALIHGIGKHLKLPAGKMHVIDFSKVQVLELNQIEDLMQDQEAILICLNIRKNKGTLLNWKSVAANQLAIHTVELFELGIISLRPIAPKQHFLLKKS